MALGVSKPSPSDDDTGFGSHQSLSRRLSRRLYFGRKSVDNYSSLPLMTAACRLFSGSAGGPLRCLSRRDAACFTHDACVSPAALIMAMVYLERLAVNSRTYMARTPPHHLFVTATLAASKYLFDDGEDEQVFNDEWAASADMQLDDLNRQEMEFLAAMSWDLYVTEEQFCSMLSRVETIAALTESAPRGGLTYSELTSIGRLSNYALLYSLLGDAVLKVVSVCSLAYVASVLTMLSSVAMVFQAPESTVVSTSSPTTSPTAGPQLSDELAVILQSPSADPSSADRHDVVLTLSNSAVIYSPTLPFVARPDIGFPLSNPAVTSSPTLQGDAVWLLSALHPPSSRLITCSAALNRHPLNYTSDPYTDAFRPPDDASSLYHSYYQFVPAKNDTFTSLLSLGFGASYQSYTPCYGVVTH